MPLQKWLEDIKVFQEIETRKHVRMLSYAKQSLVLFVKI